MAVTTKLSEAPGESAHLVAKKFHTSGTYVKEVRYIAEHHKDVYQRMRDRELTIQEAKKAIKFDAYQIRLNELQVNEGDIWQLGFVVLPPNNNQAAWALAACRSEKTNMSWTKVLTYRA